MSGIKEDRRVIRTRKLLQASLLELLEKKPFESISVTEIADNAGIARPTFYLHYASKEELMISFFDELMRGFYEEVEERSFPGDGSLIIRIFEVWANNHRLFLMLERANLVPALYERTRVALQEMIRSRISLKPQTGMSPQTEYYLSDYLAGSIFMLLTRWIEEDMPFTPAEMGQVVLDLVSPGLKLQLSVRK